MGPDRMQEVIRRVQNGEVEAFAELITAYAPGVRSFLSSHIRDFHAAEDLAQEVFIAVYANLDNWKPELNPTPWIYGIARHKLMSHLRRLYGPKSRINAFQAEITEELLRHSRVENVRGTERILGCIEHQPAAERSLLLARYFDGDSVQEIAARLGTTVSAISSQLYRLRHQLRACLDGKVRLI